MSYKVKDEKELKVLQRPSRRRQVDAEVNGGYEVVERLEKRLARLQKDWKQDHELLIAKCEEIETLKRRCK